MEFNKYNRPHPLQIFLYIKKLLIWLLIPIFRGIVSTITGDFFGWVRGAWVDIFIIICIFGMGILQWYNTEIDYTDDGIYLKKGFIIKQKSFIPQKNILSVLLIKSVFLSPFNAVQLRIDTVGGSFKKADFNLLTYKKTAQNILNSVLIPPDSKKVIQKSNLFYIMALSLITSNSFAGIMIITAFISNLGEVIGEELKKNIYDTFRLVANTFAFAVPPAAAALAVLLFIGWFVAFTANVIRYRNLTVIRQGFYLNIKGGLFNVSEYNLLPNAISYVDIRQTLLTKILGLFSVFVYAIGYGKTKNDVSAVIPAVQRKKLFSHIKKIIPKFNNSDRQLSPNFGAIFRFITDPLYFCIGLPIITLFLIHFYPSWNKFLTFIATICMVPAIWFLTVRIIDFFTSGISKNKGCFTIRYSKGFYLHTVIIPEEKIVMTKTRQSWLQKLDGKCDVFIFSYCEGFKSHKVRNLSKIDVLNLFYS